MGLKENTMDFFCLQGPPTDYGTTKKIKEEIQNRFNLISEERVNKFEQNSENLMKIG